MNNTLIDRHGGSTYELGVILRGWLGTPHRAGQCSKGIDGGVDCVHFVWAVLQEFTDLVCHHQVRSMTLDRLPQDMGLHDGAATDRTVRLMLKQFPAERIDLPTDLCEGDAWTSRVRAIFRPGDVLVIRMGENPNHAAIVGPKGTDVWHAAGGPFGPGACGGVVVSSLGDQSLVRAIARVYRPLSRRGG